MQTLIIKTDNIAQARFLSSFLRTVNIVKSVTIEPDEKNNSLSANEPSVEYNWLNPSRPATDEELEGLIFDMENDGSGTEAKTVFNRVKIGLKNKK